MNCASAFIALNKRTRSSMTASFRTAAKLISKEGLYMTRHESSLFREISNLIAKCPPPSMNVYALAGYIDACRDYGTINKHLIEFLINYCEYIDCKSLIQSGDADKEDADYYKERAYEALQLLRDFIKRRSDESWS